MATGTLYGIGIGPGDADLVTVKGARLLSQAKHIFLPKARIASESLAGEIAQRHFNPAATLHEMVFPMTSDKAELKRRWQASARQVADVLKTGDDACFITLGDTLLYSTYLYLVRELQAIALEVNIVTVPGVTAFSASAALAGFYIGEGKEPVTIIPTADDLTPLRQALQVKQTVVLMKIGKRIRPILDLLEETGHLDSAVLCSRVGLPEQRIVSDLKTLKEQQHDSEYLAVMLIHAKGH